VADPGGRQGVRIATGVDHRGFRHREGTVRRGRGGTAAFPQEPQDVAEAGIHVARPGVPESAVGAV